MTLYIVKTLALALLLAGLAAAALWAAKRAQGRFGTPPAQRRATLVETTMLAPGLRLAVVAFGDREILIGASKQGLTRLGEKPATETAP